MFNIEMKDLEEKKRYWWQKSNAVGNYSKRQRSSLLSTLGNMEQGHSSITIERWPTIGILVQLRCGTNGGKMM